MAAITTGGVSLAGCGGSGPGPTTPTSPPPSRPTATVAPVGEPTGTQLYDGQAFAITYPGGWWVHNAEEPESFGTATTIVDPANHARAVRVEVRADPQATTAVSQGLVGRRRLRFEGHRAVLSTYVVQQGGRTLRKDALTFTDDGGRGITIVTQAPQRDYATWAKTFAATRGSYLPN